MQTIRNLLYAARIFKYVLIFKFEQVGWPVALKLLKGGMARVFYYFLLPQSAM